MINLKLLLSIPLLLLSILLTHCYNEMNVLTEEEIIAEQNKTGTFSGKIIDGRTGDGIGKNIWYNTIPQIQFSFPLKNDGTFGPNILDTGKYLIYAGSDAYINDTFSVHIKSQKDTFLLFSLKDTSFF